MKGLGRAIVITRLEERDEDAWFDFGLRQLRHGRVTFYRARDAASGEWLFKVSRDREMGRVVVKALKCPPGKLYAQVEGDSMVFSKSQFEGYLYDVVSVTYVEAGERLRRRVAGSVEEVPSWIKTSYPIKSYLEATGRNPTFGRGCVTLVREDDEKAMVQLFLFEKAWPVSVHEEDVVQSYVDIIPTVRELESASVEKVYEAMRTRFGFSQDDAERLVSWLLRTGRLVSPEPGRVKVAMEQ